MIITDKQLLNQPILSLRSAEQVAITTREIIDYEKLKIVGFFVNGQNLQAKNPVLLPLDIRELNPNGFIIDDEENLSDASDIIRLQPLLEKNWTLLGKLVYDDDNHKLGKVSGYTVEPASLLIQQLYIEPTGLNIFNASQKLINRNQIIKTTDHEIIVRSPKVKTTAKEPTQEKPFSNPFRQPETSPET